MEMLRISERDIRRHAPSTALSACWRQWRAERRLARGGVHFRGTDCQAIADAYAAMSDQDFDAINARQDWANWRTIPRAMSTHVPDRPLRVIDLGCGAGSSTRVLAFYCPAGSRITGYELVPALLDVACRRAYRHRDGRPADVAFVCQPVTDELRARDGGRLPDGSVDLAKASGIVGHHLSAQSVQPLIGELRRVILPDGIAMLDVGPELPADVLTPLLAGHGFTHLGSKKSWFLDPTAQLIFCRQSTTGTA
ncbi:MAG: class I SAM-dependent methyltransferase [Planctomycetes bacterium]|nr:class I SAM-dependent methyltransferase [Planctomycetota bacterium]